MQELSDRVMARIALLPEQRFEGGEVILHAGSASRRLMFLKQGAVDIEIEDEHLARISEPGAVVGDVAILLDRPHTADVRAATPTVVYLSEDPEDFLKREPEVLLHVASTLAERLNAVNHLLVESRKRVSHDAAQSDVLLDTLRRVNRVIAERPVRRQD